MKWERKTLGDITNIFSGYAFKSSSMSKNEGIPLIKIKNILSNSVAEECDTYLIPDKIDPNMDKFILQQGDFLVAMTGQGSVGRIGRMKKVIRKFYVNQRVAIVRTNLDIANPSFVYYQIATKQNEKVLFDKANGAGQPNISAKQIGELPVALPTIDIQDKIASILSAYDDLIENNHKQIKLLEEAAQRLYKEWFVDLRFPNYENTPVVDGMPEGWRREPVGNLIAKLSRTKQVMTSEYEKEGSIPVVDQSRNFIAGYTNDRETIVDIGKPVIIFGDHTRILKYVQFPFAKGADGTQLIVSNDECMPQSLFYCSLINVDLSNFHYARHFKYLKAEEVLVPTKEIAILFKNQADTFYEKIQNLRTSCIKATEARDRLLPKLMSGELEV